MQRVVKTRLGELLRKRGVITEAELKRGLEVQKEEGSLLGEILVKLGFANEQDIVECLAIQYGFPYLPLSSYSIPVQVVKTIPRQLSEDYGLIPIDKMRELLTITMADPLNEGKQKVASLTRCEVKTFVSTGSQVNEAIDRYWGGGGKKKEEKSFDEKAKQWKNGISMR